MKKIAVMLIVLMFLITGFLSGCDEQTNTNGNTNPTTYSYSDFVQVSNTKVVTTWGLGNDKVTKSGFYHEWTRGDTVKYVVTGDVKNIGDKPIDFVRLQVTFKDDSGNDIRTETETVSSLYMGDIKSFTCELYEYLESYFEHITDYELDIADVNFH